MNFILRNSILIFIIIFSSYKLRSQSDDEGNQQKYWYYRSRLTNDFLKIGMGPGESIPFNERAVTQTGDPRTSNPPANKANGFKSGDALSAIGLYIGVLATEYALLTKNNQPTDSVRHELFCALNSINRIDHISEPLWAYAGGTTVPLNGFMVRSDIPCDFIRENYTHFNYYNQGTFMASDNLPFPISPSQDRGFASIINTGQFKLGSTMTNDGGASGSEFCDITNSVNPESPDKNTMSQDHVISLLVGLSLVNKFVDFGAVDLDNNGNPVVFPFEMSNETRIKQEARNIAERLANLFGSSQFWNLVNPVTHQVVNPGGITTFTQYGIAESFCQVAGFPHASDPYIPLINSNLSLFPASCAITTIFPVKLFGFPIWDFWIYLPSIQIWGQNAINNLVFKTELLSTGSSGWQFGSIDVADQVCGWVQNNICAGIGWDWLQETCQEITNFTCHTVQVPVPAFTDNTESFISYEVNSSGYFNRQGQFNTSGLIDAPLRYFALFGKGTRYENYLDGVQNILNSAPCEGPYNFGFNARPNFEWTSDSRLELPNRRQSFDETDPPVGPPGEYNGLDYMLIENLYRLVSPTNYDVFNLSDRLINFTLPTPFVGLGPACTAPNHCEIGAFETITADNTVLNTANLDYRAGKWIKFKSNFHVQNGANFHAFVEPFNCAFSQGNYGRVASTHNRTLTSSYGEMGIYPTTYDSAISHAFNNQQNRIYKPANQTFGSFSLINSPTVKTDSSRSLPEYSMLAFPVPSRGIVNIKFEIPKHQNILLELVNETGERVYSEKFTTKGKITTSRDFSLYGKGIFLLRYISDRGELQSQKLIIE